MRLSKPTAERNEEEEARERFKREALSKLITETAEREEVGYKEKIWVCIGKHP